MAGCNKGNVTNLFVSNAGWILPAPRLISLLAVCLAKRVVCTATDVTSHVVHEVTNAVGDALDRQSTAMTPGAKGTVYD